MSVTVSDLLVLPSLREARVLGGHKGLTRIVSSISVLESSDPSILTDVIFPRDEFFGSEIVITGFLNMKDDADCQYANMQKLADGGEAGLILFYIGVYLPRVDERLIKLANERDFVLIAMPENRCDLRYSEVLSDVMECIYRDRMNNDSLVLEILDQVSRLPSHQRSMDTVLKMLSDRISASVILLDSSWRIINLAAWPRSIELQLKTALNDLPSLPAEGQTLPFAAIGGCTVCRFSIHPDRGYRMELLVLKEGLPLARELVKQIPDVVNLSANLWSEQHEEVAIHELIRAILQDEPLKMRRLAEIFHIDVSSIHEMWILRGNGQAAEHLLADSTGRIRKLLQAYSSVAIADFHEHQMLLFLETPASPADSEHLMTVLFQSISSDPSAFTLSRCQNLKTTADVRQAYLCHQEYLADACAIYPGRQRYTLEELRFAGNCRKLIEKGEDALTDCLSPLSDLQTDNEGLDLTSTLQTYLLDGASSVTRTSQLLYLHKNTVKYRISRISERLGCRPDKMPEGIRFYEAAAVHRLVHHT